MIVKCAINEPSKLADHQQSRASALESTYPLTPGADYAVVAMEITETVFYFLVQDDLGDPLYAPAGMFELIEAPLPAHWRFALGSGIHATGRELWTHPIVATWGYQELVEDPSHFTALVDEDPRALAIFAREVASAKNS